jgi:hypothetical protein
LIQQSYEEGLLERDEWTHQRYLRALRVALDAETSRNVASVIFGDKLYSAPPGLAASAGDTHNTLSSLTPPLQLSKEMNEKLAYIDQRKTTLKAEFDEAVRIYEAAPIESEFD